MLLNMSDDLVKKKIFHRRTIILSIAKCVVFAILTMRLAFMQILERKRYKKLANGNRYRAYIASTLRGIIYDRNDQVVVGNMVYHRVLFDQVLIRDYTRSVGKLSRVLGMNLEDSEKYLRLVRKRLIKNKNQSTVIYRIFDRDELLKVECNLIHMPGISLAEYNTRIYNLGKYAVHITGYVGKGKINISERTDHFSRLNDDPDMKVGLTGIERYKESILSGQYGVDLIEVDAANNVVSRTEYRKAKNGSSVKLSIDASLQKKVGQLLDSVAGCVTILGIKTGEVLAMHSSPSFDPNNMAHIVKENEWTSMSVNNEGAFLNKNLSITYPPGSIFKIVGSLAALSTGVDPKKTFRCTGEYRLGNRVFHCHKDNGGHGYVDMIDAMAQSCNCYYYNLASTMDVDVMAKYGKILGLGSLAGLGICTEHAGIIPTKEWKMKRFKERWVGGETLNTIIGQGYVEATPMQLAIMIARVASGKILMPSMFIKDKVGDELDLDIDTEHLEFVKKALESVFTRGVCKWHHKSRHPQYHIAGKTGSAQVISQRIKNHLLVNRGIVAHALFVGYAPLIDPKFAICTVVEHGASGSLSAVPIAQAALEHAIDNVKI